MLRLFSSRVKRQMLRNIKEDSGYKMARSHLCVCVWEQFSNPIAGGGEEPPPKKIQEVDGPRVLKPTWTKPSGLWLAAWGRR
jgi:hypothetical protein